MLWPTPTSAARWTTASTPFSALQDGGLVADVADDELDLRRRGRPGVFGPGGPARSGCRAREPRWPRSSSARATWRPMKPAPPVIRTRLSQRPVSRFDGRDPASRRRSRRAALCQRPSSPSWRACRAAIQLDHFGGTSNAAGMRIVPEERSLPERPFSAVRGPAPRNGKSGAVPSCRAAEKLGELTSNERR